MTTTRKDASWPYDVIVLLALLAALLVLFQYHTLGKFGLIGKGTRYAGLKVFISFVRRDVPLDASDAVLGALILALSFSLLVLECWKQRLSYFFGRVFESERHTLCFLGACCLVLVRFYFARGESNWMGDANFHNIYAWIVSRSFARGEIPIWTNDLGAGSPFLQFYGFLFFYLVGLFNLLFRDVFFSIKWVLALSDVASGLGMYAFVRTLTGSRRAGFLGGVAYVLSFWHTQQVLIMGRLPLSVFYALLPWPFYFFERLRFQTRRLPSAIAGGIALAGLVFTHPGYAFWAVAFLILYAAVRIGRNRCLPQARAALLLLALGLALSACLSLPMWIERNATGLYAGMDMSNVPDPAWQQLLYWSNYTVMLFLPPAGFRHWYGGYLGLSLAILALAGLASPFVRKRRGRIRRDVAAGVCLLAALVLVFGYRWPLLRDIRIVHAFNAGRYLLFVVFFLSAVAGIGAARILAWRGAPVRTFIVLLAVILLDLGPTTFRNPYLPGSVSRSQIRIPKEVQNVSKQSPPGEVPNSRIFYTTSGFYRPQIISWMLLHTGIPTAFALYNEQPLAAHAFTGPFEKLINPLRDSIKDPRKLSSWKKFRMLTVGLLLLDAKYVLISQPNRTMCWLLSDASPILVSSRAESWPYPFKTFDETEAQKDLQNLIDAYGKIDLARHASERILLDGSGTREDLGTHPAVEVLDHHVWDQRVELRVRVSAPCFARLAYAFYPYLRVTVNGRTVAPLRTPGQFIALRLDGGEQDIVLQPYLSPLRRTLLSLDLALLIGAGAILLRQRRKKHRPA